MYSICHTCETFDDPYYTPDEKDVYWDGVFGAVPSN